MDERTLARFWSKVNKSGRTIRQELGECWEWTAGLANYGYGKFTTTELAHRVSFELHNGPIPGGLWVLHRCDNASCCNPGHLFLGDHQANVDDKLSKNRQPRGSSHGKSKLTEPEVAEIRRLHASREMNQRDIANLFGMDYSTINDIVLWHTWKHVKI